MPSGASHHFDGLQDGPNLDDANLNSLDSGLNAHPVLGSLFLNVEPGSFASSLAFEAFVGTGVVPVPVPPSLGAGVVYMTPGGGTPALVIAAGPFPVAEHLPLATFTSDTVQVTSIADARPSAGSSLIGSGPPSGPAGGSLAGTYPNPTIAPLVIVDADVNAAAAIVESKLALAFPTHSTANDPTADQKAALAGTSGAPSGANPYATNADARLADARTPTAHAATHQDGGGDEIATVTPAADAVPKALGTGKIADGWINRQVRGDDRQYAVAEGRTTTTLALPQLKLQIVTGVLTGTYQFKYMADVDNNNSVLKGVVRLFNVTDAIELDRFEYGQAATPLNGAIRWGGFVDVVLAGVSKTIEIQFFDVLGGGTQGIAKARMEMLRVA